MYFVKRFNPNPTLILGGILVRRMTVERVFDLLFTCARIDFFYLRYSEGLGKNSQLWINKIVIAFRRFYEYFLVDCVSDGQMRTSTCGFAAWSINLPEISIPVMRKQRDGTKKKEGEKKPNYYRVPDLVVSQLPINPDISGEQRGNTATLANYVPKTRNLRQHTKTTRIGNTKSPTNEIPISRRFTVLFNPRHVAI